MDQSLPPATRAAMRKTEGLKNFLAEHKFKGIIAGIRRDEQGLRAKERVFSPRALDGSWDFKDQPAEIGNHFQTKVNDGGHLRIHPILQWSEIDIWRYTKREKIPCVDLYFARDGQRYRSLGEKNITFPVASNASTIDEIISELETTKTSERSGRAMDRETEDSFEILRARGYM
jgi:sulfate adenylyltransferase subunit 2